jgi:hypothetical protein
MIDLQIDLDSFIKRSNEINGQLNQLPFALSVAMNEAAKETRKTIVEDVWPRGVQVRKTNFIRVALQTEFASKRNLSVSIYDSLGRGHLALHAKGGVKQGKGKLAIPSKRVTRTGSGVLRSQRPSNLSRKVVKGGLIFQAVGRGKNSKLQLMYKLVARATIKKDVPMIDVFQIKMAEGLRRAFPVAMARAMAPRRK